MEEGIKEVSIQSDIDNLQLSSSEDGYPYTLSLRIRGFENQPDLNRFVKNCEKLIRSSLEYKLWREYILDILKYDFCFVTLEKSEEVSIEVHHHIPSLFVLIKSVVNKKLDKDIEFCTFDVCLEVIEIHYSNKIGYVPLVKTIHEKVSNGYLQIPTNMIKGNYSSFLSDYGNYIEDEDMDIINSRLAVISSKDYSWSTGSYPGLA